MILALLGLVQAEAPAPDVAEGWYLEQTGRPEQAARLAAQALQRDPSDIPAHRLYIRALGRDLRQGPEVLALYRGWVRAAPESAEARIAASVALAWTHDEGGAWCSELEGLLSELPEDEGLRFWALRTRYEARADCPGDREADRLELIALRDSSTPALGYGLRLAAQSQPIDHDFLNDLKVFLEGTDPSYVGDLWREGLEGEHLEEARGLTLSRALELAEGEDPLALSKALVVLRYADLDARADELQERLAELDPERGRGSLMRTAERSWLVASEGSPGPAWTEAYEARQAWPARRAIGLLEDIDASELSPGHEADVEAWLAWNYSFLRAGADQELRHLKTAWELEPTPARANAFAYAASLLGEDLEQALEAMDRALDAGPEWDPRGRYWVDDYSAWRLAQREDLARWLDTRAWVLHGLERDAEAIADLRTSMLLAPSPSAVAHLHLGLIYAGVGEDESALFHLGRGLALGAPQEPALERRARRAAEPLYLGWRWHPLGFEAWIADQLPGTPLPGHEDAEVAWRTGSPLADVPLTIDGSATTLNDLGGIRVVDVWATWCGPCVSALPHFNEVARDHAGRGVTFLALSIDSDINDLQDFDESPRRKHYTEAWTTPQGKEDLKVRSIPSTFILDEDGLILDHWTGSGGQRLERSLEHILADQDAKDL